MGRCPPSTHTHTRALCWRTLISDFLFKWPRGRLMENGENLCRNSGASTLWCTGQDRSLGGHHRPRASTHLFLSAKEWQTCSGPEIFGCRALYPLCAAISPGKQGTVSTEKGHTLPAQLAALGTVLFHTVGAIFHRWPALLSVRLPVGGSLLCFSCGWGG